MTPKQCTDKIKYETRRAALTAIKGYVDDKRPTKSKKKSSKVYECQYCGGYHIYTEGKKRKLKPKPTEVVTFKRDTKDKPLRIKNFSSKPL